MGKLEKDSKGEEGLTEKGRIWKSRVGGMETSELEWRKRWGQRNNELQKRDWMDGGRQRDGNVSK